MKTGWRKTFLIIFLGFLFLFMLTLLLWEFINGPLFWFLAVLFNFFVAPAFNIVFKPFEILRKRTILELLLSDVLLIFLVYSFGKEKVSGTLDESRAFLKCVAECKKDE